MAVSSVEGRACQEAILFKVDNDSPLGKEFVTTGKLDIHGTEISYKTVSEDIVFAGKDGNPIASMFAYSYFRTDVDSSDRPVMFAFNGGPGSSSIWIHMGMLGIIRVKYDDPLKPSTTPPFETENNPHCLLDICDIVCIDPVGTGFSKIFDEDAVKEFWSIQGDAYAFTLLIERWLTKYDRWNSPRILCGESYGTVRNATMAGSMMIGGGRAKLIPISGLVMMGTALNMGNPRPQTYQEPSVLNFSAYAGVNWYYNSEGKGSLEEFVAEAQDFCDQSYVKALYMGNRLDPADKEEVLEKLEYYTGINKEFYRKHHMRIDLNEYRTNLLGGKNIGFYDGRFNMKDSDQMGRAEILPDDEAMGQFAVSYANAVNNQLRRFLGIDDGRPFTPVNDYINYIWNKDVYHMTTENLMAAVRRNQDLRIFFANGYYDLCTITGNTRYMVSQLDLPEDRIVFKEYAGGHMLYVGEEGAQPLEEDLRKFILECVSR